MRRTMKNTEIFVVFNDFTSIMVVKDEDLSNVSKSFVLYYSLEYDFYFTDKIKVYELVKHKYKKLFIFTNNLDVEYRYKHLYPIIYFPVYVYPERYLNQRTYGIGLKDCDEFTFIQRTVTSYFENNRKSVQNFINDLKDSGLITTFSFGNILYNSDGETIDFSQLNPEDSSMFKTIKPELDNLFSYMLKEFPDLTLYTHLVQMTQNNIFINLDLDDLDNLKPMSLTEDWPFANSVYVKNPTLWFHKPLLDKNPLTIQWFENNKFLTILNDYDKVVQYKVNIPTVYLLDEMKEKFKTLGRTNV
jgi:hypothetical protein